MRYGAAERGAGLRRPDGRQGGGWGGLAPNPRGVGHLRVITAQQQRPEQDALPRHTRQS